MAAEQTSQPPTADRRGARFSRGSALSRFKPLDASLQFLNLSRLLKDLALLLGVNDFPLPLSRWLRCLVSLATGEGRKQQQMRDKPHPPILGRVVFNRNRRARPINCRLQGNRRA